MASANRPVASVASGPIALGMELVLNDRASSTSATSYRSLRELAPCLRHGASVDYRGCTSTVPKARG